MRIAFVCFFYSFGVCYDNGGRYLEQKYTSVACPILFIRHSYVNNARLGLRVDKAVLYFRKKQPHNTGSL